MTPTLGRDPARLYLWWGALNAGVFGGFGVAALLYWVVEAGLEPLELVLLGTALELSIFVAEVPTGVMADTFSRKWSIAASHVVMGVGMILTGMSLGFAPQVIAQIVVGVGFTFQSGADVAWVTDELDDPARIDRLLAAGGRWSLWGGIAGSVVVALLVWATSLSTAIVVAGSAGIALSVLVAVAFSEHRFRRTEGQHFAESKRIFLGGLRLARHDRQLLVVLIAVLVFNIGTEAVDRLFTQRLVDIGLPQNPAPIVWFTAVAVAGSLAGILMLRWAETRVGDDGSPMRFYAAAAALSTVSALLLAATPEIIGGLAAVFLLRGIGLQVAPVMASIRANRRATSEVRATVQSFLGQAEAFGQIGGGVALGVVAQQAGVPPALVVAAAVFGVAAILVLREQPTPQRE